MLTRHSIEDTDGTIEYIEAQESPLSADIGIIHGKEFTWLFDVGFGEAPLAALRETKGSFKAVISHFHPDHMGNLHVLSLNDVFVGANTFKYSGTGTVVNGDLYLEDGAEFHIFPLPSCHAKGSLGLEVNRKFVFVGDALCPTVKSGKPVYNAGILREQTEIFKKLSADRVIISHRMNKPENKSRIVESLEKIYAQREKNSPFIPAESIHLIP